MKKHYVTYVFLIVIILPGLLDLFDIGLNNEQRKNEERRFPPFSLEAGQALKANSSIGFLVNLNADLSNYRNTIENHYKFSNVARPILMKPFISLRSKVFDLNPIPEKVINGEDGWMFIGDHYSNAVMEAIGLSTFSASELEERKKSFLTKNEWFKASGIKYFMSIAPGKHTIYGEYLPIKKSKNETKLEQLKEAFLTTDFKLIDLADYYSEHRDKRLFYKTDTHWNDLGAFLGYKRLMSEIQNQYPEIDPFDFNDFDQDIEISYQKDLTKMLNIKVRETNRLLVLKNPTSKRMSNNTDSDEHIYYENRYQSSANNLKVLVFGDSFSAGLVKYLKESFGVSVFYSNLDYNQELILKEKPDLVIQELGERLL